MGLKAPLPPLPLPPKGPYDIWEFPTVRRYLILGPNTRDPTI